MNAADRFEVAELIYVSLNTWYSSHGHPPVLSGGPQSAEVFFDVYDGLDEGHGVVAENPRSGRLMGSCFYHPRPHHVSLGIMNVHPSYFGCGVGRALVQYIVDVTERGGYPALRLTSSALNLDSFSLYNRAGFVPRLAFQDMLVPVPAWGLNAPAPGRDRVRDATLADIPAMAALEMEVSGITREQDYRYCLDNALGLFHVSVCDDGAGGIAGFLISCDHAAMNMLGPCVARGEEEAAALLEAGLDRYRGRTPIAVVPMHCEKLVRRLYEWGARNCELHVCQVRGAFQPFRGISMPSFLPETG